MFNFGNKSNDDDNTEYRYLNDEVSGIDTSNGISLYEDDDDDDFDDDETYTNDSNDYSTSTNSKYVNQLDTARNLTYSPQPQAVINNYRQIDSAEDTYALIAGINDIPIRYRNPEIPTELTAISLQFNKFSFYDIAEWQVKARGLIRKHQMENPHKRLSGRNIAGLTYINDTLIYRSRDGFERRMCNPNLTGVIEESNTESTPHFGGSTKKPKKSFLSSLFGGK